MCISEVDTGKLIEVNDAYLKLFNYKENEVIGKTSVELGVLSKEARKLIFEWNDQELIKTGHVENCEVPSKTSEGKAINILLSAKIIDPKEKPPLLLTSFMNINELKNYEDKLKLSEINYRTLYETLIDAFIATDMDGNILSCNEAFLNMLGYTEKELLTKTYIDITPSKWHTTEKEIVEKQVLPIGHSNLYEKEYIKKDGSIIPVELRTVLLRNKQGKPFRMWAIVRDVSKRKNSETTLKKILKEKDKYIKKSEDYNTSLKTILSELTDQRKKIEESFYEKISENIIPLLQRFKFEKNSDNDTVLKLLEERLTSLISNEFKSNFSHHKLTLSEYKIIEMLKSGMRVKEISSSLNLSTYTIQNHLGNIRKKLGIRNKKINLKLYTKLNHTSSDFPSKKTKKPESHPELI